ncbi:hypothetical protein H2204_006550 [Knufia peltigerae]|uniref:Peptidase M20 dimerisation domain-containing protein n=1 Tax=Knufia peltigerae TaxID=1002370 RepID=A0AA39CXI3_9EURO|nr:hypothetical protein H2204_006550 [Knufia peltigerae]
MSRVLWSSSQTIKYVVAPRSRPRLLKRGFVTTPSLFLTTTELWRLNEFNLKIDSDRLWDTVHSTARWTAPRAATSGNNDGDDVRTAGLARLTLSAEDKQARDWFVDTTRSLGCRVHVDQIGNIFAIRPGLRDNTINNENAGMAAAATFAGSHLDSQPSGGRFDGVLGVAAGVEMLRTLNDNQIETEGPVGVINWTNEEGAKFPISMMGSGVWSGQISLDDAWKVKSVITSTSTVKEDLERIGYLGDVPAHFDGGIRVGAHFELHIEQGPRLEKSRQKIGIVQGVQAYKWFTIVVKGREAHAGTTDMSSRVDAMQASAQLMLKVHQIAKHGCSDGKGLVTFGRLKVSPGSVNTIAGLVEMSLDMRHPTDEGLAEMEENLYRVCKTMMNATGRNKDGGPEVTLQQDFASNAIKFDERAIECVEQSALSVLGDMEEHGGLRDGGGSHQKVQKMMSGAGHDSVRTNLHCPTAMIFVPSKDGISHNPVEWTDKEDCAIGANVLLQSVLRMDKMRYERGDFYE